MSRELRRLFYLLAAFLLVNGLTLSRYPSVWVDEVQFADPAVSLASGQGFTSTAWFAQDSRAFWAGNVPLYPALLGGWLKVFGVGMIAERSLNLLLFTLVTLLLWRWMGVSGAVRSPVWRLIAVTLLLCGHAMVFSYRSGRYDVTGMLLAALILNAWENPLLLIPLGALLPAAGLQLIPATLVVCLLAGIVWGKPAFLRSAAVIGGMGIGCIGLRLLYGWFGVWESFRASTSAIGVGSQTLLTKIAGIPGVYVSDKSRVFVALALLVVAVPAWKKLNSATWRVAAFCVAVVVLLPAALQFAGKFPIYYGWMVFIPLVIALGHVAENVAVNRTLVPALLVLAAFAGLPLRLACALAAFDGRSPAREQQFVQSSVPAGAVVLSDFRTYYALRAAGIRPFLPTYLPALYAAEKHSVDLLILRPQDAAQAEAQLGGTWVATGAVLPPPASPRLLKRLVAEMREETYSLAVYRRVSVVAGYAGPLSQRTRSR